MPDAALAKRSISSCRWARAISRPCSPAGRSSGLSARQASLRRKRSSVRKMAADQQYDGEDQRHRRADLEGERRLEAESDHQGRGGEGDEAGIAGQSEERKARARDHGRLLPDHQPPNKNANAVPRPAAPGVRNCQPARGRRVPEGPRPTSRLGENCRLREGSESPCPPAISIARLPSNRPWRRRSARRERRECRRG